MQLWEAAIVLFHIQQNLRVSARSISGVLHWTYADRQHNDRWSEQKGDLITFPLLLHCPNNNLTKLSCFSLCSGGQGADYALQQGILNISLAVAENYKSISLWNSWSLDLVNVVAMTKYKPFRNIVLFKLSQKGYSLYFCALYFAAKLQVHLAADIFLACYIVLKHLKSEMRNPSVAPLVFFVPRA